MIARKPTRIVLQSSDKDDLERALAERGGGGGVGMEGVQGGGALAGVTSPRQGRSAAERLGLAAPEAPAAPGGGGGGAGHR